MAEYTSTAISAAALSSYRNRIREGVSVKQIMYTFEGKGGMVKTQSKQQKRTSLPLPSLAEYLSRAARTACNEREKDRA
jgi:hypothetical protein